jgi:8-oxo-dGTP pyrophosphatase MutT (NUDIX family)
MANRITLIEKILKEYFGTKGAGILPICISTGRVLLNLRSSAIREPNTWGVWGGSLDDSGDTNYLSAAKREFNEESGYSGPIKIIPAYVYKDDGFEYHNFIGLLDEEFTPHLDWESADFGWFTFNEFLNLNNLHPGVVKLFKNSGHLIQKYMLSNELVENIIREAKSY